MRSCRRPLPRYAYTRYRFTRAKKEISRLQGYVQVDIHACVCRSTDCVVTLLKQQIFHKWLHTAREEILTALHVGDQTKRRLPNVTSSVSSAQDSVSSYRSLIAYRSYQFLMHI